MIWQYHLGHFQQGYTVIQKEYTLAFGKENRTDPGPAF